MHKRAAALIAEGDALVLEKPYTLEAYRADLLRTFIDIPLFIVQMRVPHDIAIDRFRKREGSPAADLTEERVEKLNREYPYTEVVPILDGTRPFDELFATAQEASMPTPADLSIWRRAGLSREVASISPL
jgi:hypothetical protein